MSLFSRGVQSGTQRLQRATSSTPGRYRAWSMVTAAVLALAAVCGLSVANRLSDSTERLESNTGPVLVATQQAVANLAEADAAATAAFMAGDEDRESRRLYEEALARAVGQIEDVSALIGRDAEAHDVLKELGSLVTRYAALVEAARAENRAGVSEARASHLEAVRLLAADGAAGSGQLIDATEDRLERDARAETALIALAVTAFLAAFVLLFLAQVAMTRRSRRILNLPLVLATIAAIVSGVWLVAVYAGTRADLDTAKRDGYESITLTADLQVAGQRTRVEETIAVIDDDDAAFGRADDAAGQVEALLARLGDSADSDRERAAVTELDVRWQRYREAVGEIEAAGAEARRELALGAGNSTFNGFNVSVESVLGDNRADLIDNLEQAHDRTRRLTFVVGLVPLAALLAALFGFQLRIKEYR